MITKIKKLNNYFITKPKKVFVFLSFVISGVTFLSIFFLFMTVSYKYSILEKNNILDNLLVQNSIQETEIFNLENENYYKNINKTLVFADNIIYLRSKENLAMNVSR